MWMNQMETFIRERSLHLLDFQKLFLNTVFKQSFYSPLSL
jgi:hypothetical protein